MAEDTLEKQTEEGLGLWDKVKGAVTRPLPDDYYETNLDNATGFLSRNKDETPMSVEAASFLSEAIPGIGDAIAAKEVWDELQKAEPNYYLVGALGGATVVGLVPGVGDAAAKAIKKGAKEVFDVAKRVEVDPNAMGSMGGNIRLRPKPEVTTPRFNEEALRTAANQNDKSRDILVEMPIDDFLNSAEKGLVESKLEGTRALVAEGTPFSSVPNLTFRNNGDGTAKVVGHEGRHRALALREQGETTMPVVLTARGGDGPAIRWGQQNNPDSFDYVDVIPQKLIEEDGTGLVSMPRAASEIRTKPASNLDNWSKSAYFKDPETGQPQQMYHGMGGTLRGEPIDFLGDNLEPSYAGTLGPGTYITNDPSVASDFATGKRGAGYADEKFGGQVFPVYTNVTNVVDDAVINSNRELREELADRIVDVADENGDSYLYDLVDKLKADGDIKLGSLYTRVEDGKVRSSGVGSLVSEVFETNGYEAVSVVTDKGFHEAVIFQGHGGLEYPKQNIKSTLQGPDGAYSRETNDMRFAEGGLATKQGEMDQMNKMFKEGGLATDGMDIDPISGNDIPVGSNAVDVRDDVDAKLSSGEYVVPADVVKYLGVAQLEKLVNKAKDGLEDMEENGRIGGAPVGDQEEVVMTLGADLGNLDGYATGGIVEGMDYNAIIDRVKAAAVKDPSITNMLKAKGIFIQEPQPQGELQQAAMSGGAVPAQAAPPAIQGEATPAAFAEGGMAYGEGEYEPSKYSSSYNPYDHTPGFSIETGVTGRAPGTPYQAPTEAEVPVCPEGYVWDPEIKVCMPVEAAQPSQPKRSSGRTTLPETPKGNPNAWMEKYSYDDPETLFEQSMTTLGGGSAEGSEEEESSWLGSLGDAAKGLLSGGLAGGLVGKFMNTTKSAQVAANAITLRAMGREDLADQLVAQNKTFVKDNGLELVPSAWRDGDRLAASVQTAKGDLWSTDATQRASSSTGGGSRSTAPTEQAPLVSPRPKSKPSIAQRARIAAEDKAMASTSIKRDTTNTGGGSGSLVTGGPSTAATASQRKAAEEKKAKELGSVKKDDGSYDTSSWMNKGGLVSRRKPKK